MAFTVRRLAPGDEPVLRLLATEDHDFDLDGRGHARAPLADDALRDFLADPAILAWIAEAEADCQVLGFLYAHVLRKRVGAATELLLYEIGVRADHRRAGVGRALAGALAAHAATHGIRETWVLADNPGAVEFYRACGFTVAAETPTYMTIGDDE